MAAEPCEPLDREGGGDTTVNNVGRTARIGVDVGGTFTDLVLHDDARGLTAIGKLLADTDPTAPAFLPARPSPARRCSRNARRPAASAPTAR
jgi:hypothetical protein